MTQIRFDGITESGDRGSVYVEVDANGNLQTSAVSSTGVAQTINPDGSADVNIAGGIDGRGNYPVTWFLQASATIALTAADDSEIYGSGDVSMYNYHIIENASPVDPVTVQVTLDGTNWSGDFAIAGVAATPSIATGEFGVIEGKFFGIRVLKNGTTSEIPLIRYAHSVK